MEITKHIKFVGDVTDFLNTVGNFGKKFYALYGDYGQYRDDQGDPVENLMLHLVAVGISRELTYIIHWDIMCIEIPDRDKIEQHPHRIGYDVPHSYLEPINDETKKHLYPFHDYHQDTRSWTDVFNYNGFIQIDNIINNKGKNLLYNT